jgi:hypothetical protein
MVSTFKYWRRISKRMPQQLNQGKQCKLLLIICQHRVRQLDLPNFYCATVFVALVNYLDITLVSMNYPSMYWYVLNLWTTPEIPQRIGNLTLQWVAICKPFHMYSVDNSRNSTTNC